MEEYLTTKEVAQMLGISTGTVRTFLKMRYFNGKRIGRQYRIDKASFSEFLQHSVIYSERL